MKSLAQSLSLSNSWMQGGEGAVGVLAKLQDCPCSPLPKSSQGCFRTDLKRRRKELSPQLVLPMGRSGLIDCEDPIRYL